MQPAANSAENTPKKSSRVLFAWSSSPLLQIREQAATPQPTQDPIGQVTNVQMTIPIVHVKILWYVAS
jgi:hypothetical protein